MKIVLLSIGTRGDMEPFLAIGEILKNKGHHVICAFPEQFRGIAAESNLEFATLGKKFINMLDSDAGKAALGGSSSGIKKFMANITLARKSTDVNKELIHKQFEIVTQENPDRIVYNGKAIYPIIWGLENKGKNILICPVPYMHYVRDKTHVAFNSNYGPALNRLTYSLADFGMVMTTRISARWLKITSKISRKQIKNALHNNKVIYTISPTLFAKPPYWNKNLKVLGFHQAAKNTGWRPDNDLTDFLDKHKKVLFITFGSMINPEPAAKTRIFTGILERQNIPAIINTAAGGLAEPDSYNRDLIRFVSNIPYQWIFPRTYAVIHHGGAGTTHMALKHGCATMIIPHIIDQFVWNRIIHETGAGPKGIKASRISVRNLESKILDLMNNSAYKNKAEQIAGKLVKEDFREEICRSITEK